MFLAHALLTGYLQASRLSGKIPDHDVIAPISARLKELAESSKESDRPFPDTVARISRKGNESGPSCPDQA